MSATGLCISRTYVSPATTIRAKNPRHHHLGQQGSHAAAYARAIPRVLTVDVRLAEVPTVLLRPPVLVTTLP